MILICFIHRETIDIGGILIAMRKVLIDKQKKGH